MFERNNQVFYTYVNFERSQKGMSFNMKSNEKEYLYNKIEELEQKRMAYLEINDTRGARRIQKRIDEIEFKIEFLKFEEIKKKLEIYKKVVRNYPSIQLEIKREMGIL